MSFWFLLWVMISACLLGFLFWTILILMTQKKVWKNYAEKHKLRYKPNNFFDAPDMNGIIDTHSISLFSGEHSLPGERYTRKMTSMEIQLASKMPIDGGMASGGFVDIIEKLGFKEELEPQHSAWKKSYIASADNKSVFDSFLTKERLDALLSLMKVEKFWVIFIFKEDTTLLRLDVSDPLGAYGKLDKIVKALIKVAQTLELRDGEADRLKLEVKKRPKSEVSIEFKDDEIDDIGLQLEEDEDYQVEPESPKPSTENEKSDKSK